VALNTLQTLLDEEKSAAGWWTMWVWIITGVYLFSTTQGVSLISLTALIFLGAGMFVSVIVFGIGFYMLLRLVALTTEAMHRRHWINIYGPRAGAVTHALGLIIFLAEITCTALGARWAFHRFVPSEGQIHAAIRRG
jgi:hypothetical protein